MLSNMDKYQTDNENDRSSDDDETINHSSPTYENLLYENKMKSQALLKASNLIEILKCELEVQKNAHQEHLLEAVQAAQDEARAVYRVELEQLRVKIQLLEREIERQNSTRREVHDFSKSKEVIPTKNSAIVRNKSASSLSQPKSKEKKLTRNRSVSKKLQQTNERETMYSFEKHFYKQLMVGYQERQEHLVQQFRDLFQREKEEISTFSLNNRRYSDEFAHIYRQQRITPSYQEEVEEMRAIIQKQETLIEQMKIYQMGLEDLIKGLTIKISSIFAQPKEPESEKRVRLSETLKKMQKEAKVVFAGKYNTLVEENQELRNIIEQMINLIRQKKEFN